MMMNSRRVSLPVSLRSPVLSTRAYPSGHLSPLGLSPRETRPPSRLLSPSSCSPAVSPTFRRSLPSTPGRSLPSTPRTPHSPRSPRDSPKSSSPRATRHLSPSLPDVEESLPMEHFPPPPKNPSMRQISEDRPPMRSFDLTSRGLVDRGLACESGPKADRRRATCPDIYLYSPEGRMPARRVLCRVYGSGQTGKRTVAQQIYQQAALSSKERSDLINEQCGSEKRIINFLLNGEEIQLEVLIEAALESDMISAETLYVVVYRVDSRDSLSSALRLISRLPREDGCGPRALLVANKCDLQRARVVSTIDFLFPLLIRSTIAEGRTLAKIYKVPFVEVSALMSVNTVVLWEQVLRLLTPPIPSRSILGRVVASCEQLVRNALSFAPSNRSVDEEEKEKEKEAQERTSWGDANDRSSPKPRRNSRSVSRSPLHGRKVMEPAR